MYSREITVRAPTNIALIKYWGKADREINLPLNSSISLTVDINTFFTETQVSFLPTKEIFLSLNGKPAIRSKRVLKVIDSIKSRSNESFHPFGLKIETFNSFPTAAGMASSASGLAALSFALSKLYNLTITTQELSSIARLGSGSASRSLYGGIVEWKSGQVHSDSYSSQLYSSDFWPELTLLVIIGNSEEKDVSSTDAMQRVTPSLNARASVDVPKRITMIKSALADHDFETFANVIMEESDDLHRVINEAGVFYLNKVSFKIQELVRMFNATRNRAAYTFDAGPNAWIVIRKQDISEFLHIILQEVALPYGKLLVKETIPFELFTQLQQRASLKIEKIVEAEISASGPIEVRIEVKL